MRASRSQMRGRGCEPRRTSRLQKAGVHHEEGLRSEMFFLTRRATKIGVWGILKPALFVYVFKPRKLAPHRDLVNP